MPSPGLSLVGFLDRSAGIATLRNTCVLPDQSDDALGAEWEAARAKLGAPMERAGNPEIQELPPEAANHVTQVIANYQYVQQQMAAGMTFKMVELDPLLAYQFTVDKSRSDHHNGGPDAGRPNLDQLLAMCLPLHYQADGVRLNLNNNSMLITSDDLNFRLNAQGWMPTPFGNFVGIQVGAAVPLLHVVLFNGRYYLHNGFHRAVGLSRRGVTHAPCVVREVLDAQSAAIGQPGTFDQELLESANPPTVGHFAQGRAHDVNLKVFTRTMHVSWADHITTRD